MIQQIVTPVPVKKTVACIVHEGIKYCEISQLTNKHIGVALLTFFAFFVWTLTCSIVSRKITKRRDNLPGLVFALLFPCLVIGLILLFN